MSIASLHSRTMSDSAPPTPSRADNSRGLLLVISGPSGVGKTTIVREVIRRLDAVFSVSATTRPKTVADVEGRDYFFITEEEFQRRIEAGDFLEYAQVFGRSWYGTPKQAVNEALEKGRIVLLEIDVQGALQINRAMPEAFMIFVEPPNEDELLRRLRERKREDESAIARRFAESKREIKVAHESDAYDAFVVNDQLERAVREIVELVNQQMARA